MTIRTTYQARLYDPTQITVRYVRFRSYVAPAGQFQWCEVNAERRDIRQGICDESDLPPAVATAARANSETSPGYVEWPLN